MAVKGSLASLGLEDLLQADLAAQGAGRLTLRCGPLQAALYVDPDGVYVLEPDLLTGPRLVSALLQRGILSEEAYAKARTRDLTGTRLLDALVEEGVVPEAEFLEMCASAAEDTILDLMLWEEGQFRFEVEPREASWCGLQGRLCVDPRGILQRALARIDERVELATEFGEHTILFGSVAGELPALQNEDDPLHHVYARLDGQSVVHEIALQIGIGRFEVLRTIRRLAAAGLARVANVEEVVVQVNRRTGLKQHDVARALCLQWAESEPMEPGPLKKLASVSEAANNRDAALDALCALGHMHVKLGDPAEAVSVFKRAMRKAPADEVVLAGLQVAAEATGDDAVYADSTLLTAQAALDEDEAARALEILSPLIASDPGNVAAHLLRARALCMTENTQELLEQAEVVGQHLSRGGMKTKQERDAAAFFRATLAEVAPDRGDLLERFRSLHAGGRRRRKRITLVAALLLLAGVAAFTLLPPSAEALLEDARTAVGAGDTAAAEIALAELLERYPDSPEAQRGLQLKAHVAAAGRAQQGPEVLALQAELQGLRQQAAAALPDLPAPAARERLETLVEKLEGARARPHRKAILGPLAAGLREVARELHKDTLARVSLLNNTAGIAARLGDEPDELARYVAEATRSRDPDHVVHLVRTASVLERLSRLHTDGALELLAGELERASKLLQRAGTAFDVNVLDARVALMAARIAAGDQRCREEAPRLLVAGKLEEALAIYTSLHDHITTCESDDAYAELRPKLERLKLPHFIRQRRDQILKIRSQLERAKEAEDQGDLEAAIKIYTALKKSHWLIRFDSVIRLPLRVRTVPPGASVTVGGESAGTTPTVVHYPLGREARIVVRAPGYVDTPHVVPVEFEEPPSEVILRLRPEALWSAPCPPHVEVAPVEVDGDVLTTDRRGVLTRHAGADGAVRWTADHSSLEGVRTPPVLAGERLYLACVDGRLRVVEPADGARIADVAIERPHGDLAVLGDTVAVAAGAGDLLLVRGLEVTARHAIGGGPSAGVLAAHGAFWAGTADGEVVRIGTDGSIRRASIASATTAVLALAATPDGVLATTAGGTFAALAAEGSVRWKRDAAGNPTGAPAQAGGLAAFVDARRGVLLFDARTGEPRATLALDSTARAGLVSNGTVLLTSRDDGRLWAYDPAADAVLIDADSDTDSDAAARFPPAILRAGRAAVPGPADTVRVIPLPRRP